MATVTASTVGSGDSLETFRQQFNTLRSDLSGLSLSDITVTSLTATGVLKTDDTTEATSTTDGSLQTDGGLSVVKDAVFGDDVKLLSDASVLAFGADGDVTITHVADTGILLNSTSVIQFNDASQNIGAPSATVLDINATDEIELNATLVDVNANLDVSGTYTGGGLMTTGGNIVIPDAGNIGSASDTDAIAISSGGVVTFTQAPVFPDGSVAVVDLDIDGATDIGAGLADADLIIVDDGAGGTNRKAALSRLKTYIGAGAADDLTAGDAAVNITTTTGNITIDAQEGDTDIIFKGTDGSSDITALTLDMSDAGTAIFNNDIKLQSDDAVIKFGADGDVTLTHDPDDGLILKGLATGDNEAPQLTFQTGETDIQADDAIGTIKFQAPDEATGSDANLVVASFAARSEGDFSATANATFFEFRLSTDGANAQVAKIASTGQFSCTPTATLLIKNSSGSTLKTINGVASLS